MSDKAMKKADIKKMLEFLKNYDGSELRIMEICGSHTGALTKTGIREVLSPKIKLISGPGCPVCVTPSAYIDRLLSLALDESITIVSFGDMLRVPGSEQSLSQAKGAGADVRMVYSPDSIISMAKQEPERQFVFAAVGFETTAPVYAMLLKDLIDEDIKNVRLLTALKTMPEVVSYLCESEANIDGFLAPGHVCAVTGSNCFKELASTYNIPFVPAGFTASELVIALFSLVKLRGQGKLINCYPEVVTENGNEKAKELLNTYFEKCDATWRGIGKIKASGLKIKEEFSRFDAGSLYLDEDIKMNKACICGQVLIGRSEPSDCPLFGKICTPISPQGACMVSAEGKCADSYRNKH